MTTVRFGQRSQEMSDVLQGKIAIITGANRGLGREIASHFVASGASVVLCARDAILLAEVRDMLIQQTVDGQFVELMSADVSRREDVERVICQTLQLAGRIDILVNNAGIYGPMGEIDEVNWDDWVQTLQVNVLGSVLMARAVLPTMKQQRGGKIIQLSGGGATQPMPRISAYAVSKAAIVRFAETLSQEVRDFTIDVNAIAPGALNTGMLDEVIAAGPDNVGQFYFDRAIQQKNEGGISLSKGAELAVFLASSASNGITGKLISAVWDDWQQWPQYVNELSLSDAYTLRRITGRDRGLNWGDK